MEETRRRREDKRRRVRDELHGAVDELRTAKRDGDHEHANELSRVILPALWFQANAVLRPEDFPPGFRLFMTVPRGVKLLREGREKDALRWLEDEQDLPRNRPVRREGEIIRETVRDAMLKGVELPVDLIDVRACVVVDVD